jgi:death-on-curing protein
MVEQDSPPIDYLTLGDVLRMHRDLMGSIPAPSILLDEGKLESALLRPEHAALYEQADLFLQAATLAAGIALALAFEDGNKRLAYVACLSFVRINGVRVPAQPLQMADEVIGLVDRGDERLDPVIARFAAWLREHHERA